MESTNKPTRELNAAKELIFEVIPYHGLFGSDWLGRTRLILGEKEFSDAMRQEAGQVPAAEEEG